ncbi:hypothetical protein RHMOL_Rhmol10G0277800 [Rhododendron molle]|uniref:Uncharacterized protein n=1 Tax=Rhododendron molle TaxID=49168 RepID=A0ACC0M7Z2_RHOML|nr:hypothetical protein RHMOL_Rhmol10G0277800 [Rhododendron molle]
MELPANPIPAVVLLLSLLAAAPLVSARLKTYTITYDDFYTSNPNTKKLHIAGNNSTLATGVLRLSLESDYTSPTNQSGRILYDKSFKLWEGQNDTYSDRVASFNTSFLVILNQKIGFPTPGAGLTFVVAPDLSLPPNSFGRYLGLTNFTTDGNVSNQIIAIELDTFKDDFDPDSNHVGLNINSFISKNTTSLTPHGFDLVPPYGTHNFFNVWVQYDGIKKTSGRRPVDWNSHVSTLSSQIRQQVAAVKFCIGLVFPNSMGIGGGISLHGLARGVGLVCSSMYDFSEVVHNSHGCVIRRFTGGCWYHGREVVQISYVLSWV